MTIWGDLFLAIASSYSGLPGSAALEGAAPAATIAPESAPGTVSGPLARHTFVGDHPARLRRLPRLRFEHQVTVLEGRTFDRNRARDRLAISSVSCGAVADNGYADRCDERTMNDRRLAEAKLPGYFCSLRIAAP